MNKLLLLLLALGFPLMAQEKQVLWEESRSYYSGAEFVYKLNEGIFLNNSRLIWTLYLSKKKIAQGSLDLRRDNEIKFKLPRVKDASLIKGKLELVQESKLEKKVLIPFFVLGDNFIQYKHEAITILSDEIQSIDEDFFKENKINIEFQKDIEAVKTKALILYDVELYPKLLTDLKDYTQNGGVVWYLGTREVYLDLSGWTFDKVELVSPQVFREEVKGFNQSSLSSKYFWSLNLEEQTMNLLETNEDIKLQPIVKIRHGRGSFNFCTISFGESLQNDPSLLLLFNEIINSQKIKNENVINNID